MMGSTPPVAFPEKLGDLDAAGGHRLRLPELWPVYTNTHLLKSDILAGSQGLGICLPILDGAEHEQAQLDTIIFLVVSEPKRFGSLPFHGEMRTVRLGRVQRASAAAAHPSVGAAPETAGTTSR